MRRASRSRAGNSRMRGLIAVLLFVWGVAFGLAEPTPPSQAPGAAADASGPRQPASSLANEPRVLERGGREIRQPGRDRRRPEPTVSGLVDRRFAGRPQPRVRL